MHIPLICSNPSMYQNMHLSSNMATKKWHILHYTFKHQARERTNLQLLARGVGVVQGVSSGPEMLVQSEEKKRGAGAADLGGGGSGAEAAGKGRRELLAVRGRGAGDLLAVRRLSRGRRRC